MALSDIAVSGNTVHASLRTLPAYSGSPAMRHLVMSLKFGVCVVEML